MSTAIRFTASLIVVTGCLGSLSITQKLQEMLELISSVTIEPMEHLNFTAIVTSQASPP
jgi:hypothetical protein